jgi:PAS domain-containing protein
VKATSNHERLISKNPVNNSFSIANWLYATRTPVLTLKAAMDMASTQFHDRLSALERENAILRSRLQSCEQSYSVLQAEIATYRREDPAQPKPDQHTLKRCLLEATATVANTLLSIEDFDIAVNTALQILGETLETDRLIVAENFVPPDSAIPYWRLLYEWDSPGTVSQIVRSDLAQGSWEGIEAWYEQLNQGQNIVCFIEDMPEPFRKILVELGTKAIHSVPIFVAGQCWGQLGFDDCREAKRRSVLELSILRIAADCIGSAIQQQRTQQALLQAEQQRSQELKRHNIELQQTLDRLSKSEQRHRTLFELSNEGIYHFKFDTPIPLSLPLAERLELAYRTNRLTEANQAFAQQYGLDSPADIIGTRIGDFYVEDSQKNRQTNEELLTNFQICNLETEEIDRFGNHRHFLSSVVCTVENDELTNGWGIQMDITELRETQQALLESEQARSRELERANIALQNTVATLAKRRDLEGFIGEVLHTGRF